MKKAGEELLSLREACAVLGIAVETGRNWVRLGKWKPDSRRGEAPCFRAQSVEELRALLGGGDSRALKQRRNKTLATGSAPYRRYLREPSVNGAVIRDLLADGQAGQADLPLVLAEFSLQLLAQALGAALPEQGLLLPFFWSGALSLGKWDRLIRGLAEGSGEQQRRLEELSRLLPRRAAYLPGEDFLGYAYLSLSGLDRRKAAGAYYTPGRWCFRRWNRRK